MKIKEKISVIIRCRNEERYIGHSIQSIINFFYTIKNKLYFFPYCS